MEGDGSGDTGGDGEPENGDGWNDENSSTLWGWLDGVVSGLKSIWETLTNLPQIMLDGIKSIFIPDTEEINNKFNSFLQELKMKFSFDTDFFEGLFQGESVVNDVYEEYEIPNVGTFNFKFFDSNFFVDGVTYFRPFIRGFLVLLLAIYNVKQFLSFIRQDAGVATGKSANMETRINKGGD